MPTVHVIRKDATPEQLGWRARIARAEKPLLQAFLDWVARVQQQITDSQIAHAVITQGTRAFDHVVLATVFEPDLGPAAVGEAEREFGQLLRDLDPGLRLSFDLRDPNFDAAVRQQQARLVREVTGETRRAISNVIARAYRNGLHPYDVAPQIRAAVGLTSRQAQAVLNFAEAQRKAGRPPATVADRAVRYAGQLRTRRAKTIATTETSKAMTQARLMAYQHAADRGLFDPSTAELEWSSVQTNPAEICAQLDGTRVPFGSSWDGKLPGFVHPSCRCSAFLVLNSDRSRQVAGVRPNLTLV